MLYNIDFMRQKASKSGGNIHFSCIIYFLYIFYIIQGSYIELFSIMSEISKIFDLH